MRKIHTKISMIIKWLILWDKLWWSRPRPFHVSHIALIWVWCFVCLHLCSNLSIMKKKNCIMRVATVVRKLSMFVHTLFSGLVDNWLMELALHLPHRLSPSHKRVHWMCKIHWHFVFSVGSFGVVLLLMLVFVLLVAVVWRKCMHGGGRVIAKTRIDSITFIPKKVSGTRPAVVKNYDGRISYVFRTVLWSSQYPFSDPYFGPIIAHLDWREGGNDQPVWGIPRKKTNKISKLWIVLWQPTQRTLRWRSMWPLNPFSSYCMVDDGATDCNSRLDQAYHWLHMRATFCLDLQASSVASDEHSTVKP